MGNLSVSSASAQPDIYTGASGGASAKAPEAPKAPQSASPAGVGKKLDVVA